MCVSCDIQIARPHALFQYCNYCEACKKMDSDVDRANRIMTQFHDRGLTYLGSGSNRAVYVSPSGRYVYKVPINAWGVDANIREHQLFRHKTLNHPTITPDRAARCRLAPSGVLVMELVRTDHRFKSPPSWAMNVDGGQVGLNREDKWVAYDYGYE